MPRASELLGELVKADKPWLGFQARRAALEFQAELLDIDPGDSLDVEFLPVNKFLLHKAIASNGMSATFAVFGVQITWPSLSQHLLLHYSAATKRFRLYCVGSDYATHDMPSMVEHLNGLDEAVRVSGDRLETRIDLQELAYRFPLVAGPILSELSELSKIQGPEADCLTIPGLRSRISTIDTLEALDPLDLDRRYPLATTPPIQRRSRSIYPFDIMNVGEAREIGPYSEQLINRVRSAISTHRLKHPGKFQAVIDPNHDKVLIWRQA